MSDDRVSVQGETVPGSELREVLAALPSAGLGALASSFLVLCLVDGAVISFGLRLFLISLNACVITLLILTAAFWCWRLGSRAIILRGDHLVVTQRGRPGLRVPLAELDELTVLAPRAMIPNPILWFAPDFGGVVISTKNEDAQHYFVEMLVSRRKTAEGLLDSLLSHSPEFEVETGLQPYDHGRRFSRLPPFSNSELPRE